MSEPRRRWADAFLRQARSDLAVYHLLSGRSERDIPRCHALHYLQMACEKIAKAYRIRGRFSSKFDLDDVRVIGHYTIRTPPPEEKLPMPAVALAGRGVLVALKWDFGAMRQWPFQWTVSVRRRSPYLGPIFGLFEPSLDLRGERVEGLAPDFVFGPYRENPAEFTCEVEDEWDAATLLRLVLHEA
jgi:hypothetical protein